MIQKNGAKDPEELSRMLDYHEGDIVQILHGKAAGKVAVIIGINFFEGKQGKSYLIYELKLSDKQSISLRGNQIKFVKHGDDIKT